MRREVHLVLRRGWLEGRIDAHLVLLMWIQVSVPRTVALESSNEVRGRRSREGQATRQSNRENSRSRRRRHGTEGPGLHDLGLGRLDSPSVQTPVLAASGLGVGTGASASVPHARNARPPKAPTRSTVPRTPKRLMAEARRIRWGTCSARCSRATTRRCVRRPPGPQRCDARASRQFGPAGSANAPSESSLTRYKLVPFSSRTRRKASSFEMASTL